MKKLTLLLSIFSAFFTVSCVPMTKTWEEVFAQVEEDIDYHDKKFMKSKTMYVPHGVDESRLGKWMKFNFSIERGDRLEKLYNRIRGWHSADEMLCDRTDDGSPCGWD